MKRGLFILAILTFIFSSNIFSQKDHNFGGSDEFRETHQLIPEAGDIEISPIKDRHTKEGKIKKGNNRFGKDPFKRIHKQKHGNPFFSRKDASVKINTLDKSPKSVSRILMETYLWMILLGLAGILAGALIFFLSFSGVGLIIGWMLFVLGILSLSIGFTWLIVDLIFNS